MNEEELQLLRRDMIYGSKFLPEFMVKIVGLTKEEEKALEEKRIKEEKEERRKDILDAMKFSLFIGFLIFIAMSVPFVLMGIITFLLSLL